MRSFLDCAYATLVGEYQRIGLDLLTAVERTDESIGLGPAPTTAAADAAPRVPSPADNDRALAELQRMMAGA